MPTIVDMFFNLDIMRQALPLLMSGLWMTLQLCAVVIVLGLLGGLALGLCSISPRGWVRRPTILVVDLLRAIPPLVLLIFVYSGLPFAGVRMSPFMAVVVAFLLNNSAYYAEVYRAGLQSVPKGQWEAARATGLSKTQMLFYVIIPQAVRNVLPDLLSNTIEVVKLTSLASVVSLAELLYQANMVRSVTYNSSPLVLAAAIYLILLWPLVRLVSRYQRKMSH